MAQTWTTTELLEAIREDGRIPDDTPDATSAKLLRVANRVLAERFVPLIRRVRAEYYIHTRELALVADKAAYDLPAHAATNSVRLVFLQDSSGNRIELTPLTLSDRLGYTHSGTPSKYTIEDDQIVLLPPPNAGAVGRYTNVFVKYEVRPNTLVEASTCGLVSVKTRTDASTVGFTVDNVSGGTFRTAIASSDEVDWVKGTPPFSPIFISRVIGLYSSVTGAGILTTNSIAEDTYRGSVGDYMALPGETPIPQIPAELHPALAYAVIANWYEVIDPATTARFETKASSVSAQVEKALAPRQQGRQQKARGSSLMRRHSVSRSRGGTFDDWE